MNKIVKPEVASEKEDGKKLADELTKASKTSLLTDQCSRSRCR